MKRRAKDALDSMYGEGHLNATRTRECVAMPGVRDQKICSPPEVIDPLHAWWGYIEYDPCGCDGSIVNARRSTQTRGLIDFWPDKTYFNPPYGTSLYDPEDELELLIEEERIRSAQRFARDWNKTAPSERLEDFGYEMPPEFVPFFGEMIDLDRDERLKVPKFPEGLPLVKAGLEDWLAHHIESANLGERTRREIVGLVPNRTHRSWLRRWRHKCDATIDLDPLKFLVLDKKTGKWAHANSAFPAPLVLGYTGRRPQEFCDRFAHLGDPA